MPQRPFFYSFPLAGFLLASCVTRGDLPAPEVVEPLVQPLGPGLSLEIDPRLELLAGVQSWTSWTTDPDSDGYLGAQPRVYAQQLRSAFEAFRHDPAVTQAQDLLKYHGFSYDAPPAFVLATENGMAFDPPALGFSTYLVDRAGGAPALKSWGASLRTLAVRAHFSTFFDGHRAYYQGLLDQASRGLHAEPLAAWLKSYYGSSGEFAFHFVLAPAMMPGGGYGTSVVRTEDGRSVTHVYQVIRDAETVSGARLAGLTLHEFGHSFVNPSIGDQVPPGARARLEAIFEPVKEPMKALAYSNLQTFLNELVLRATTIRGQRLLGLVSDQGAEGLLAAEVQRGFYPIRAVYQQLPDYEAHRDQWPRFQDFGPELLTRLAAQADTLKAGLVKRAPVASFRADFGGQGTAPGAPFDLSTGATTEGDGRASEVVIDTLDPARGTSCLTLRGQAETSLWNLVSAYILPQKGTVVARFHVRAQNLHHEAKQFNNAWAGFLVEGRDGKTKFEVHPYQGTFGWRAEEVRVVVDPAQVKALRFGMFLSVSGELSFDEVAVTWE